MIDAKILEDAKQSIVAQNRDKALAIAQQVIDAGNDPMELMTNGFVVGINHVGDLFGRGQMFLPELVQAADVMKAVTEVVEAALPQDAAKRKKGRIVVATVRGDVHDIGKCIVVSLLNANGFEVHDLGRDIESQAIIDTAVKVQADVIGTSALLTTTMSRQKEIEQMLKKAGLREKFKTIVGGAPVTNRWADKIGADAYAEDAQDAVVKIQTLIGN